MCIVMLHFNVHHRVTSTFVRQWMYTRVHASNDMCISVLPVDVVQNNRHNDKHHATNVPRETRVVQTSRPNIDTYHVTSNLTLRFGKRLVRRNMFMIV